ncbi:hypothetical protein [Fibrella arboris]|uniref:hypothetical protein n=1 Tax=Fibrella arboris TaxID=3242486 RepID=UPI003520F915
MKNYFVITLGTREIQLFKSAIEPNGFEVITEIRKETPFTYVQPIGQPTLRISARGSDDFPDFFTISPRIDGEIILKKWPLFRPILDYPLIRPALEYLKTKSIGIDIIMLVFTDQEQAFIDGRVKKRSYINNDTVYFADMIERFVREDTYFNEAYIDHFGRYESVADMAIQYTEFGKIKDELISDDEVSKVYLFPQGGIDQINQALTLRLIETFEGRVVYLQNAEGKEVQELDFPRRFVNVLQKQKLLKHLADYDFGYIDKTLYQDKLVCHLAQYAVRRLSLQHNQLKANVDILLKEDKVKNLWAEFSKNLTTDEAKLSDLYLSAKISCKQGRYNEFLWKAFTLNESLFKIKAESLIGSTDSCRVIGLGHSDNNQLWLDKLNQTDSRLVPYLQQHGIGLSNPYRKAYVGIVACLSPATDSLTLLTRVADKLESLASKRHGLAHKLGTTSLIDA